MKKRLKPYQIIILKIEIMKLVHIVNNLKEKKNDTIIENTRYLIDIF